ncbi:hypothetical protein D3C72_2132630 [compost metagenome]
MNQSSTLKNGWSRQRMIMSRPVKARARRTAAVVTSEPFLANLTISAQGTKSTSSWASSASSGAGRVKLTPFSSCVRTLSSTGS